MKPLFRRGRKKPTVAKNLHSHSFSYARIKFSNCGRKCWGHSILVEINKMKCEDHLEVDFLKCILVTLEVMMSFFKIQSFYLDYVSACSMGTEYWKVVQICNLRFLRDRVFQSGMKGLCDPKQRIVIKITNDQKVDRFA